jgi:DNA-binding response OmpR family regulator
MSTGRSVLIVDDEPTIVEMAKLILQDEGYTVFTASSAELAIKRLGVITPSIILLDVNMPDENGYQLCSRIRRDYPHVQCPIVFFTGNNTADHLRMARDAGGDYFVIKPFSAITLVTGIKRGFMAWGKKRRG